MRVIQTAQEFSEHKMICPNHSVEGANATAAVADLLALAKQENGLKEVHNRCKELRKDPSVLGRMVTDLVTLLAAHEMLQADRVARYEAK